LLFLLQAMCALYRDKVLLLNKTTEVINYWQDEEKKHTLQEVQEAFPDCKFQGS
jgi:30S ribosomal protein 3